MEGGRPKAEGGRQKTKLEGGRWLLAAEGRKGDGSWQKAEKAAGGG